MCKNTQDWILVLRKLRIWYTRTNELISSTLGLVSILQSRKSLEEAQSARLLTILGTIFLPLSLSSGVLSMGGDFLPGKPHFWIYFVISVPLVLAALSIAFGLQTLFPKSRAGAKEFQGFRW